MIKAEGVIDLPYVMGPIITAHDARNNTDPIVHLNVNVSSENAFLHVAGTSDLQPHDRYGQPLVSARTWPM